MAKAATKIADNRDSKEFAAMLGEMTSGKFEGNVVKAIERMER